MASYDYGSPSPSPPPPDGRTYHQKQARMSDLLLQLRRRANDGPADRHSRHREQQQQHVQVINSDDLHLIAPIRQADGTTRRTHVIICKNPRRPGVGKVFLEYVHLDDAAWCRGRLDGMCYNGKEITAEFFPQAKFAAGDYV